MFNVRIVYIDNTDIAKNEIEKIGADKGALPWLLPKAVHIAMKLENVSSFAANIVKQEMLSKGGDVAVNKGVANFSSEKSDILIMGTYGQYIKLTEKLMLQSGSLKTIGAEIKEALKLYEKKSMRFFQCRDFKLPIGEKTYVMGILNVTPDSFSDGGSYRCVEAAVKRAKEMVREGAHIIDVGGESTRPGHEPVELEEEIRRVVPVIERLAAELDVPISVDTSKSVVAKKALEAGAHVVNDIWGLQRDREIAGVAASFGAGVIMMHNRDDKEYKDLMGDIIRFLRDSIIIAKNAGIDESALAIDPGIGFGKTMEHNIEVLKRLKELKTIGLPILLGTSRKSFIGNTLDLPVSERVEGTAATVALGISSGADIVRVHDVKEMARVARMTDAVVR
jgi:dihydropteroate synthase